mgnify:CR=1 FL=1
MLKVMENMNKEFIAPTRLSPFYPTHTRIPRKLKKEVKIYCGSSWNLLHNSQRLWHYLGYTNPKYKKFIIKEISR